jgi:hypothetical protein
MGVSCKRVGCRVPATTTVVIHPPTSTVTLVDVEVSPMGVTLCSVHATGVTPPMNWVLVDDRDGDLRLLPREAAEADADDGPAEPAPAPARRARRRRVAEELFSRTPAGSEGPEDEADGGRRAYRDAG